MVDWDKLIANAGFVLFSSLAATVATGSHDYAQAIATACIAAGVAFFGLWKTEEEGKGNVVTAALL